MDSYVLSSQQTTGIVNITSSYNVAVRKYWADLSSQLASNLYKDLASNSLFRYSVDYIIHRDPPYQKLRAIGGEMLIPQLSCLKSGFLGEKFYLETKTKDQGDH